MVQLYIILLCTYNPKKLININSNSQVNALRNIDLGGLFLKLNKYPLSHVSSSIPEPGIGI